MKLGARRYRGLELLIGFAFLAALFGGTDATSIADPGEGVAAEDSSPILWSESHESGTTDGWSFTAISGNATAKVTTERAHTGNYANRLTIHDANGSGTSPGVRMEKHKGLPGYSGAQNMPRQAYYSVYFYFPQHIDHDGWFWNVFQWKRAHITSSGGHSRHPTWVINVLDSGANRMTFMLERKVDGNNKYMQNGAKEATAPIDIPIGRWVHLECLYKWSMAPDGQITCWQDGVKIWDIRNARTDLDYSYLEYKWQWVVNSYAAETSPTSHSIWIDDAAISLQRLGPNWKSGVPPGPDDPTCAGLLATIVGTPGKDTLTGTPGRDVIQGRGGNDVIRGGGGNDVICGGGGSDIIAAGSGRDKVRGGAGNDTIYGEGGKDVIAAMGGSDKIYGGSSTDKCWGGSGSDTARGCETLGSIP